MSGPCWVIAVAGWEDRFALGLRRDIEARRPKNVIIITFEEFLDKTAGAREAVRACAELHGSRYEELVVSRERVTLFRKIQSRFSEPDIQRQIAILDISTMPREVIWWACSELLAVCQKVEYVYHSPAEYSGDWITRDTAAPQMLFKHSGISSLEKETALLILTGFDTSRLQHLIQVFEPKHIAVGIQVGNQFDNQRRNSQAVLKELQGVQNLSVFEVDAFKSDRGFAAIVQKVDDLASEHNIIATSLGPKPGAIGLYQVHRRRQEIALAYAPSRQFNFRACTGIGDTFRGTLT